MRKAMKCRKHSTSERKVVSLFEPYVQEWINRSFDRLTPPQIQAWPLIAEGSNTLIFAPTGSGKTLAAFLWCINELFRTGMESPLEEGVHVLYVSPLKALNNDIQKNLKHPLEGIYAIGEERGLRLPTVNSLVRTGDTSAADRARMAAHPPHILITTPESLYIILTTQKFRERLRPIRYVIVDEIHAIFDNKRGTQLVLSLERLHALVGRDFVRIGCSATQSPVEEVARFLVGGNDDGTPRDCAIVDIGARKNLDVRVVSPVSDLLEARFDEMWEGAASKIRRMIAGHDTTLVFTNSRYRTERLTLDLQESAGSSLKVGSHHGSMSKEIRLDMEDRLKSGKLDALVATSSLELGIDVGSVDLVCQTESPKSVCTGIQRVGRAGHLLTKTSKGRLLVTDKDDLVECAAAVKGIMGSRIDASRLPEDCLDMLAQHILACCAADAWCLDDLYRACRRAHPFRDLARSDFDQVIHLLCGDLPFMGDRPVYPKIHWDRVARTVTGARSARLIAFRCSGAIPDVADYAVVHAEHKTKIGTLDEAFVECLHAGSVFVLGNTTWQVVQVRRNRVYVRDVYGVPPTIPAWGGERPSRTFDLGVMVGELKERMAELLAARSRGSCDDKAILKELRSKYYLDADGAKAVLTYFGEQYALMGTLPTHRRMVVESFTNQMGHQQIVIHSVFGIRANDALMLALQNALRKRYGCYIQGATEDDGILLTPPEDKRIDAHEILNLVTPSNFDKMVNEAIINSPVFASRFRHNAVRSLMILREYRGRKTPVWAQDFRSAAILQHVGKDMRFPIVKETLRECRCEALDVPGAKRIVERIGASEITVEVYETKAPSPFSHSLLLVGQYGDFGGISNKQRHARLLHLHREVLKQLLSKDELKSLLRREVIEEFVAKRQHTTPKTQARDENEVVSLLSECGGLSVREESGYSVFDRVRGDVRWLLDKLWREKRILQIPMGNDVYWIATHEFPIFRDALRRTGKLGKADRRVLAAMEGEGQATIKKLAAVTGIADSMVRTSLARLEKAFLVVRAGEGKDGFRWEPTESWLPKTERECG